MAAHLPSDLALIASKQGRCFSRDQAGAVGLTVRQLRVLEQRGVVVRRHPRVFGLVGDDSWGHHLWAAILQFPGAVASHESAGRLHLMTGLHPTVSVIVAAGSHPRSVEGVRIHQVGPVPPTHLVVIDGMTVTTIERTLCDLAGSVHPARLGYVLDLLLVDRRTALDTVGATLAQYSRRGREGGPALGRLLDERAGRPTPRSRLEAMLDEALATHGLVASVSEYPLPTDGSLRGFVDRAFPEARLIVEADGRRWHARYVDFARDRARDRLAAKRGWLTIRVAHEELRTDPAAVASDVLETYLDRVSMVARESA